MHVFDQVPDLQNIKLLNPELKAIIFDMDGTLLNTEIYHYKATDKVLQLFPHKKLDFDLESLVIGNTDQTIFKKIEFENLNLENFLIHKNSIFMDMMKENRTKIISQKMLLFVHKLKESKTKLGLVTSSEKDICFKILEELELTSLFDEIITREDTIENKPSPVPYLEMIERLKISASEAFIFEDSKTGIAAAESSQVMFAKANWY